MNPETKNRIRALVNNLRSGKFRQIKAVLKREEDERCAIGCVYETYKEITGKGTWNKQLFSVDGKESTCWGLMEEVHSFFGSNLYISSSKLTQEERGSIYGDTVPLYALNDNGVKFNRIADLIEQQYLQETV